MNLATGRHTSSWVLHAARDARSEDRPIPRVSPGQVLVKMQRMGICGSDVHYFLDGHIGRYVPTRPFVLGHEASGEIVAVAPDVDALQVGARVAIDPATPCRACRYCMEGRYNLCPNMRYLGSASTTPPTDGIFSEYAALPARNCFALPDALGYAEAAMVEPLSVAIHAARQAGMLYGASVLITGGGAIGQLVLLVARAFGAGRIALSDVVEERRSFALQQGADAALNPANGDMLAQAAECSPGGFDVVFEVSGAPPALRQAFETVRPGGSIVQVGSLPAEVSLPANLIMSKELRLVGSFRFANVFQTAIDLAASGRINLRPLITHTFPLAEFPEAMRVACARTGAIKVQISVNEIDNTNAGA